MIVSSLHFRWAMKLAMKARSLVPAFSFATECVTFIDTVMMTHILCYLTLRQEDMEQGSMDSPKFNYSYWDRTYPT